MAVTRQKELEARGQVKQRRREQQGRLQRWDVAVEMEVLRDLSRKSFWMFFMDIFGAAANPKGEHWIDVAIHKPIADWFQKHVDAWFAAREAGKGQQMHLALLVPREFGKSTIITQAGQLWLHARDPETSSYTGCESTTLAKKMLEGIKGTVDGSDPYSLFTKIFGAWSANARSWSATQITHAARRNTSRRDPSLGTFSVETSIVGSHPDAIFYDDPISYERLTTDTNWLQTVNSQVTSLFPVIQRDGLVVWVGTRYDDDDHFGVAFREEGVRSLEGMETDSITVKADGKWDVYFLAGRDADSKPICDRIWDEERLQRFQKRDPLRYAAQVLNDPSVSEFNPITRDQLRQSIVPTKEIPWGGMYYAFLTDIAFWDGKSRARKDETVVVVVGYAKMGMVYFIEGYGSQTWREEDFKKRLVTLAQRYRSQGRRIRAITGDLSMGGLKGAWSSSLRNAFHDGGEPMPTLLEFSRGGNKKIQRIVNAAGYFVEGFAKIAEGSPGNEQLMDQMSRIGQMMVTRNARDDWADAFSDAFQPELYTPMRRLESNRRGDAKQAPWERGSQLLEVDGLDHDVFMDDDWSQNVPRPPIR